LAALCTLDAVRYRLPLVQAVSRLSADVLAGPFLLDTPGVVRGPAAQELLQALIEAAAIDVLLAILPKQGTERDLALKVVEPMGAEILITAPSPLARRLSKKERARARTLLWDAWLERAAEHELPLAHLRMSGSSYRGCEDSTGRQLALVDGSGRTLALGEVTAHEGSGIRARLRQTDKGDLKDAIGLVRDAARRSDGMLGTMNTRQTGPPNPAVPQELISPSGDGADPACFVHLGTASALLVNGLFGDPLLHLRLRQQRRSLLFDLGDSARLPAKIAHQVSDVFISHAHMDHISGFLWFLRSRIGVTGLCRLYGPPGLADHVCAFIAGIRWDRIGNSGPRFEILELHRECLRSYRVQVGMPREEGEVHPVTHGVLLEDPGFRVRAITLDHGIPVLAFAFEVPRSFRIRKDRLAALGLSDGPWLGALKRSLTAGEVAGQLVLPDGRRVGVSCLAHDLVERSSTRRMVYATDLMDSPENRRLLIEVARGADALICEAAFSQMDSVHAARTGHLTAGACGEVAALAGVARLVPFHFSRRYESDPTVLYGEVEAAFKGFVLRPRLA
jgi:ribonuclease BN (tRNA processing enzyme)